MLYSDHNVLAIMILYLSYLRSSSEGIRFSEEGKTFYGNEYLCLLCKNKLCRQHETNYSGTQNTEDNCEQKGICITMCICVINISISICSHFHKQAYDYS